MAKEELLTIEGIIDEILPDGRFGVMLDNEHRIIAYTAGRMRRFRIRSIVGDRVHVEMTPYDYPKAGSSSERNFPGNRRAPDGEDFVADSNHRSTFSRPVIGLVPMGG